MEGNTPLAKAARLWKKRKAESERRKMTLTFLPKPREWRKPLPIIRESCYEN